MAITENINLPDELSIPHRTIISDGKQRLLPTTLIPPTAKFNLNKEQLSKLDFRFTCSLPDGLVINAGNDIETPAGIAYTDYTIIIHEYMHQLEAYLGVEEMVSLYRGLYARTIPNKNKTYSNQPIEETGIAQTGDKDHAYYGMGLYLPEMSQELHDIRNMDIHVKHRLIALEDLRYAGTISRYPPDWEGKKVSLQFFGTEFLSTTAELLANKETAEILLKKDPMRAAMFLKIANPPVYNRVKCEFEHLNSDVSSKQDLDKILHMDISQPPQNGGYCEII